MAKWFSLHRDGGKTRKWLKWFSLHRDGCKTRKWFSLHRDECKSRKWLRWLSPNDQNEKKGKLLEWYYETQTALKMHMEKEDQESIVNKLKQKTREGGGGDKVQPLL